MAINTTTALGFIKKNFADVPAAKAAATAGKIVFDSAHNIICVDGEVYGGNVQDADFTNSVLTITKGDGTDITIDFSDVASASSMMSVFTEMANAMGVNTSGSTFTPNYSGTNYLTGANNMVAADKALDTQIKSVNDAIAAMDGSATIASESNGVVTIKTGVSEADGIISNASGSDITLAKVATTGAAVDVAYDNSGSSTSLQATNVQAAIEELEDAVAAAVAGGVNDVKFNGTSIVSNNAADIAVDGIYNASTNKIATKSTVDTAIEGLDVTGYAQATVNTATAGQTTLTIKGIKEDDGKIANDTTNDADIVIDGEYNASTNKIATQATVTGAVTTAIQGLDGSATIASKSGDVVTIKTGVVEADGVIDNDSGTDIVLAEVASTGAAANVSIADAQGKISATDVEGALTELALAIEALQGSFDVRVSTDAASTPQGVTWGSVTGTLAASADTFHKIYLVPATGGASPNSYSEYITTKSTSGSTTTYSWEKLGDVAVDLTGYVKSITVNGKNYEVTSGSTNIALGNVITAVTGETEISGGNSDFVAVTATPTVDSTTGANSVAIASKVKVQAISTAATSTAEGLAEASDVKSYVDTKSAVVNSNPTIVVNDSSAATIGTVGGNALTAKVALYWDEWETA